MYPTTWPVIFLSWKNLGNMLIHHDLWTLCAAGSLCAHVVDSSFLHRELSLFLWWHCSCQSGQSYISGSPSWLPSCWIHCHSCCLLHGDHWLTKGPLNLSCLLNKFVSIIVSSTMCVLFWNVPCHMHIISPFPMPLCSSVFYLDLISYNHVPQFVMSSKDHHVALPSQSP